MTRNTYTFLIFTLLLLLPLIALRAQEVNRPVDLVYPLLDAANSRWFYFNSATRPFGMVNLSPDTQLEGAWGSGYRYDTDTIKGFSHIHAWQMSGVSVMPVTLPAHPLQVLTDYFSPFNHEKETVEVGYHEVFLERYGIEAALTSTARVGFHRYRYPKNQPPAVLFHLGGPLGPSEIVDGELKQTGPRTIAGKLTNAPTTRRPKPVTVYFEVSFDREILNIIEDAQTSPHSIVSFAPSEEILLMKVSVSYTSPANARLNMDTELPEWDFENTVTEAKEEWDRLLGRIKVEGSNDTARRRFYTDLWHALQGRRTISDVNGAYPDNTGTDFRIGQIPLDLNGKPKFRHFNSDSFWGAQWTLNTLWGLVYPEIMEEFVLSFMQYYEDGGLIPRGPSGGNYTYVMTGASSTPFFVAAYQKGLRGFDVDKAYEGLKKNHMPGGMMSKAGYEHLTWKGGDVENYIQLGYVPFPNPKGNFGFHQQGASLTLEYSYQDWTLAQLAKKLGKNEDASYFLKRSENYRKQYDRSSGWMRPRDLNGEWMEPFDPYDYGKGFIESNAAQFTWFVPHDLPGLAELMGGKVKAAEKLNMQFRQAEKLGFTSGTSHAVETNPEYRKIPINYGNQPSMQTAFVFNYLNRPDLTQYWSRKVVEKAFSALSPQLGYNGDEDQGLMGSLAVLMKLGLFQMNGGTETNPIYELGSPTFDKVTIQLNPDYYPGKEFNIIAENNSDKNYYIQQKTFNGVPLQEMGVRHFDIIQGGTLHLTMGIQPKW